MKKVSSFKGKLLFLLGIALFAVVCAPPTAKLQWYRGNLHTHSYWSDGDDFPEMVVDWYKSHGYHFLALSDHNILAEGEMWVDVDRLKGGMVSLEKYRQRFGADWIEERTVEDKRQIRLKTFAEYRPLLDEEGRFLLMPSEEISDSYKQKPIHVNATNLTELILPQGGSSVAEVMANNIRAVLRQREESEQPMFPHLNHPNFHWAVMPEDLLQVPEERFFEVYNGHPAVRNYGDSLHLSTEQLWDIILTERLSESGDQSLYGLAIDDAHNYHDKGPDRSNPGRGWVMVRAAELTPEALVAAMEAGDFYASTGVQLKDIHLAQDRLTIRIRREKGVRYITRFVGTRRNSDAVGEVLKEAAGTVATYRFTGDEIYVRAKVISTKIKANPYQTGEVEVAWTQPVMAPAGR